MLSGWLVVWKHNMKYTESSSFLDCITIGYLHLLISRIQSNFMFLIQTEIYITILLLRTKKTRRQ